MQGRQRKPPDTATKVRATVGAAAIIILFLAVVDAVLCIVSSWFYGVNCVACLVVGIFLTVFFVTEPPPPPP